MIGTELLEALPVAVYTTDAEGWITYFNDAAVDLWGHRPSLEPTNGAGPGACIGPMAVLSRVMNVRWQ